MGYHFAVGECIPYREEGELHWGVPRVELNGAPWFTDEDGWGIMSCNGAYLNNVGTLGLMGRIIPELLGHSLDQPAGYIINVTPQVLRIISTKLEEMKAKYPGRPYFYGDTDEIHYMGVLVWMKWWCTWALKKCIHPVIIYG